MRTAKNEDILKWYTLVPFGLYTLSIDCFCCALVLELYYFLRYALGYFINSMQARLSLIVLISLAAFYLENLRFSLFCPTVC